MPAVYHRLGRFPIARWSLQGRVGGSGRRREIIMDHETSFVAVKMALSADPWGNWVSIHIKGHRTVATGRSRGYRLESVATFRAAAEIGVNHIRAGRTNRSRIQFGYAGSVHGAGVEIRHLGCIQGTDRTHSGRLVGRDSRLN